MTTDDSHTPQQPVLIDTTGFSRKPIVVVVDDQAIHIQFLYQALAPECQVFMATSGEQAIKVIANKKPDLVLLDVEMPGMNGFDVIQALKSDGNRMPSPVIFVTSHNDPDMEAKCLNAGAVDYITKPININVVRARVSAQLQVKLQTELMNEWAVTDGLTGARNHRHFKEQLPVEWSRCQRLTHPLSVMVFDIDFFKGYNEQYGHRKGDDVLRAISACAQGQFMRAGDVMARTSGDEFAAILPNTPAVAAQRLADNVCEAIKSLAEPNALNSAWGVITVSVGVASCASNEASSADKLVEDANRALSQAKKEGGNRVVIAD